MNLARPSLKFFGYVFQFWLTLRRLLPKQKCQAFGATDTRAEPRISKVYVINLDRERGRWSKIQQELGHTLEASGRKILSLTERYSAIDANAFREDPTEDTEVIPFYTLSDQLYVEPQPSALPAEFELNTPIRMSRAEVAIARSHINIWKKIAAGSCDYAVVLEDDVWFHNDFAAKMDQTWTEIIEDADKVVGFDILYLSYVEAKHGAPKRFVSENTFLPYRGLWHLSAYVLSRDGAQRLLGMLPCRGPIDLWINQQFDRLNVRAVKKPIISQRRDAKSTNSYSILPALTTIGVINSERASLFHTRPAIQPVFAFGPDGSGQTSLAMALCMLGYRCASDLSTLPAPELERLFERDKRRVFNAYVNIGSLRSRIHEIRSLYPKAKFIFTTKEDVYEGGHITEMPAELDGADVVVLHKEEVDKWQVICEHLRCAPPNSSFPKLNDLGQRPSFKEPVSFDKLPKTKKIKWDKSPWVVEPRDWWGGIHSATENIFQGGAVDSARIEERFESFDTRRWIFKNDTFIDNLALFRPSNVLLKEGGGAIFLVKDESLGVREYSAASICSRKKYLFGKFEAVIKASDVPGIITGFFLHRNSPRQEIDIEIVGNRPDRLLVNVFHNPGDDGANFDYGYRGTPCYINLGFDASKASHRYTIEWSPSEILWKVDGQLVHRRVMWGPTPIPHLPMMLHFNSWPCRSVQLSGRINRRRLPSAALLESVFVKPSSGICLSKAGIDDRFRQEVQPFNNGKL